MPGIAVFLSYPKPSLKRQAAFVDRVVDHLADRGFEARTLGVTDYDMQAPLTAIRRLMLESTYVGAIAGDDQIANDRIDAVLELTPAS